MKKTQVNDLGFFYGVLNQDDSNMKMREREAGQSGELFGSERFKAAVRAAAERQMPPKGSRCVNHLGGAIRKRLSL